MISVDDRVSDSSGVLWLSSPLTPCPVHTITPLQDWSTPLDSSRYASDLYMNYNLQMYTHCPHINPLIISVRTA